MSDTAAAPAARIVTLDILRGVAVMGILVMNINAFALPGPAYDNPRAFGGASGADLAVWATAFVLIDGKMRGLFSLLFGASLLLVAERAEARGHSAARVHYARMAVLLVIGLLHLWLFWWGDILHHYALIGIIAFAMRKLAVPQLLAAAMCVLMVQIAVYAPIPADIYLAERQIAAAPASPPAGALNIIAAYRPFFGVPGARELAADLALHRADYATIAADRFTQTQRTPFALLSAIGAQTLAYMLIGMAAFRSGLLSGAWPAARYARWAALCFALTLPAYLGLAWLDISTDFDMAAIALAVLPAGAFLQPVMMIGWACLILFTARGQGWLVQRIAAAGRMAFSNYLGTTLACTVLFYGYGFGLYGLFSRAALIPIAAGLCLAMLLWSKPWLARFRYGPMEWLWRSAARGRWQPMRR